MSLSDDVNMLIGHYGIAEVHKVIQQRMKDDYEYLKSFFDKKEVIKLVNKVESTKTEVDKPEPTKTEPTKTEPVVTNEVLQTSVEESEKKKFKDSKEQKLWQREMEEKKKKENLAKGISIKDLLTKENLKKWIEEDGRTYSYIAREYTGCKDSEVSAAAKAFGIENTRKNLTIQSKK
jgi:hypothetical protein